MPWGSMRRLGLTSRHRLTVLLMLVLAIGTAALRSASYATADPTPPTPASVEASAFGFLNSELQAYATTLGPFQNGVWTDSSDNTCWACNNGGPATAAATAYMLSGGDQPQLLSEAEQTINTAIATRQNADGSFSGPPGDTQSANVSTMFFGLEFGTTYHLLASDLDLATRTNWQASLAAAANYLIDSGDTTWYANGNINLGYTEFLYLVWQATGNTTYEQAYNASWNFTMDPPQDRFPGSGLVITQQPTQADGADGMAYLTEAGVGGNGFDPDYTQTQLDTACRLYLLSGDPRALRLANMLLNTLMPLVSTSTWLLNTSGGTRHPQQGREDGFMTSAFAVLGLDGGRSSLVADILPELEQEEAWYPQPGEADSAVFRRAFGDSIALVALAAAGQAPDQGTVPQTTNSSASSSSSAATTTVAHAPATSPDPSTNSYKPMTTAKKANKAKHSKPRRPGHIAKRRRARRRSRLRSHR
jgi:hypothetical protein